MRSKPTPAASRPPDCFYENPCYFTSRTQPTAEAKMVESMHTEPTLSRRIWAGDVTAVENARKRHEADPEGQFVPWILTLYSFRDEPTCKAELLQLRDSMVRWSDPEFLLAHSNSPLQAADGADVLST